MFENKKQIINSIEENCRLLNEALEAELRKSHNDCPVIISERCIDLIKMTIQYTELYLEIQSETKVDILHKSTCLVGDEPMK